MPKVSIIIPIYNVEYYVNKTVDSVISQTEKDIEIILVDDGSTDNSDRICDEYALKDDRIIVLHKENGGLSSARNAGLDVSTGDHVLFLDGDDYLRSDAVEFLLKISEKYQSDFIQFDWQEVEKDETPIADNANLKIYQAHTPNELFKNLYDLGGVGASACTKFFKKEFVKQNPYKSIRHEDEMWCSDAFKNGIAVTYVNRKLYYYVMRANSIIHEKFNAKRLELFDVIEYRLKTLEELNLYQLYQFEYNKLFCAIVGLYCDAKIAKDKTAKMRIKAVFKKHKKAIKRYTKLSGRYKALNALMTINFDFINLYYLFCKRHNSL